MVEVLDVARERAHAYVVRELKKVIGNYTPRDTYVVQGAWRGGEYCEDCVGEEVAKAIEGGAPQYIHELLLPPDLQYSYPVHCNVCRDQLKYELTSNAAEEILDCYIDTDYKFPAPLLPGEAYEVLEILNAIIGVDGFVDMCPNFLNVINFAMLALEAVRPPDIQLDLFEEKIDGKETDVAGGQRDSWADYEFV